MGWVKTREDGSGTLNRCVIAPARSADKLLSAYRLSELQRLCPGIDGARRLPLWRLLDGEAFSPQAGRECLAQLSEDAYWTLHEPIFPWIRSRAFVWELDIEQLTEEKLLQLCFLGTLDGVAVLWLLLSEAVRTKQNMALALRIGAHLPPALALYARTSPAYARIAVLIFARLRQLVLDPLRADNEAFAFEGYDLRRAANEARDWPDPEIMLGARGGRRLPSKIFLQPCHEAWINRWRGSLVAPAPVLDASARRWHRRLRPSNVIALHPAGLHPLSPRAKKEIRRSLGGYW